MSYTIDEFKALVKMGKVIEPWVDQTLGDYNKSWNIHYWGTRMRDTMKLMINESDREKCKNIMFNFLTHYDFVIENLSEKQWTVNDVLKALELNKIDRHD